LVTDRNQSIPVLNTRTGVRALAFGNASVDGELELRFLDANVDMQAADVLTTSGIDGVYPPGLQVARVKSVARQSDSTFARIRCEPMAQVSGALHVLVLKPVQLTPIPVTAAPIPPTVKKSGGKP